MSVVLLASASALLSLSACSPGAGSPAASPAVCADLRELLPELRTASSPARAQIALVVDLSSYYQRHQGERPMRGAVLDRSTRTGCAGVRRAVLGAIDKPSFSDFFAY